MARFSLVFATMLSISAPASSAGSATPPWVAPSGEGDERYFAFHKPEVGMARATADLQECIAYMIRSEAFVPPPEFVLLGEAAILHRRTVGPAILAGVAADLITGMFARSFAMKKSRGNLRRCMSYKGYKRYAIDKGAWTAAFAADSPVEPLATLAVGEPPRVGELRP